jgi:hypothetical protein
MGEAPGQTPDEPAPHPRGALLLILIYLVLLVGFWTNLYLKLWIPEGGRLP